jgi:hypothetical protein
MEAWLTGFILTWEAGMWAERDTRYEPVDQALYTEALKKLYPGYLVIVEPEDLSRRGKAQKLTACWPVFGNR